MPVLATYASFDRMLNSSSSDVEDQRAKLEDGSPSTYPHLRSESLAAPRASTSERSSGGTKRGAGSVTSSGVRKRAELGLTDARLIDARIVPD